MNTKVEILDNLVTLIVAILTFLGIAIPSTIKFLQWRNRIALKSPFYKNIVAGVDVENIIKPQMQSLSDKFNDECFDISLLEFSPKKPNKESMITSMEVQMIYSTNEIARDRFGNGVFDADASFSLLLHEAKNNGFACFVPDSLVNREFVVYLHENDVQEVYMFITGVTPNTVSALFFNMTSNKGALSDYKLNLIYPTLKKIGAAIKKNLIKD